jgi:hypothetical protein
MLPLAALGVALLTFAAMHLGDSPQAAHAATNCDTSEAGLDSDEQAFLVLLNQERASLGAGPLVTSPILDQMAAWKSADSASAVGPSLSHTDSLGRDPYQRAQACGLPHPLGGENVLYGAFTAQQAFALFKSSQLHYQNMTLPNWKSIGIGKHGTAWTLDFSSYTDSGAASPTAAITATVPASTPTRTAPPATATATPVATNTPTPAPTATPTATPMVERQLTLVQVARD